MIIASIDCHKSIQCLQSFNRCLTSNDNQTSQKKNISDFSRQKRCEKEVRLTLESWVRQCRSDRKDKTLTDKRMKEVDNKWFHKFKRLNSKAKMRTIAKRSVGQSLLGNESNESDKLDDDKCPVVGTLGIISLVMNFVLIVIITALTIILVKVCNSVSKKVSETRTKASIQMKEMNETNVSANDQITQLGGSMVYNVDGKTLESETSESEINDNEAQRKTIYGQTVAI